MPASSTISGRSSGVGIPARYIRILSPLRSDRDQVGAEGALLVFTVSGGTDVSLDGAHTIGDVIRLIEASPPEGRDEQPTLALRAQPIRVWLWARR